MPFPNVSSGRSAPVSWTSLSDLPLLPEMEAKSHGHLRRRAFDVERWEVVEIQRRKVIVRALAFIARLSGSIGSE